MSLQINFIIQNGGGSLLFGISQEAMSSLPAAIT